MEGVLYFHVSYPQVSLVPHPYQCIGGTSRRGGGTTWQRDCPMVISPPSGVNERGSPCRARGVPTCRARCVGVEDEDLEHKCLLVSSEKKIFYKLVRSRLSRVACNTSALRRVIGLCYITGNSNESIN